VHALGTMQPQAKSDHALVQVCRLNQSTRIHETVRGDGFKLSCRDSLSLMNS